jgi:hypothetical protein
VIAVRELDEEQPILDGDATRLSPGGAEGLEFGSTADGARPLHHEPVGVDRLTPCCSESELLRATEADRFYLSCAHGFTLGSGIQTLFIRFHQGDRIAR